MLIKRLRYKNILSTGNSWIDIDFIDTKTTLVYGENGAGKSTMISALVYCLYGKDFRGIKKNGLLNSINNKKLITECWFSNNGNEYKVIRGMKPDVFEIYKNDIQLESDGKKLDQQKTFEDEILKFPYNSFKQVVVTGSGQYVPFMKLTAGVRREFLETLLEIDIFSKMQLLLKDKISNNNSLLSDARNKINLYVEKIKFIQMKIEEDKQNSEKVINEYDLKIQENLTKLNRNNSELDKIDIIDSSIIIEKYAEVELTKQKISNALGIIQSQSQQLTSKINRISDLKTCSSCLQEVNDDHKKFICTDAQNQIDENSEKYDKLQVNLKKLIDALGVRDSQLKEQTEIKNMHDRLIRDNQSLVNLNNEYTNIISNIKNKTTQSDTELSTLKDSLLTEKDNFDKLTSNQNLFSNATLLLKDTGIKSVILKKYVEIINKLVNQYLEKFEFYIQFTLDENFNEVIKSRYRDEFSYENFSEGEKSRIDLALLFTFRQLASMKNNLNCNLLIADEIFDSSIDSNGADDLQKIFGEFENMNIVVISHREQLQEYFDRNLSFKKIGNFSHMEVLK